MRDRALEIRATRSSVCDGRIGNGRAPRRSNDGSASRGDPRAPRPAHEPRGRVVASSGPRRYPGSRAASTNAPRGCSCLNVERADILGRVCAVRSIFLSSRDASPRRATLNARSMGAREVTGVIPGKIGQSGAEIFTNGCGKKAIFERRDQGKLDRRFRIPAAFRRLLPRASCAGIIQLDWSAIGIVSACSIVSGNGRIRTYGARCVRIMRATHNFYLASSRRMCSHQTDRSEPVNDSGKVPSLQIFSSAERFSRRLKDKTTARVCLGGAATACPRSRDRRDPRARPDFGSQTPGSMATDVDDRRHFGPAPRFLHKV